MLQNLTRRTRQIIIIAVCVTTGFVLLPLLAYVLGIAVGLSLLALQIAGYAILLVGIPFFLWIIGEAAYKVFLRPFVRARRIRTMRSRRLLREAAARRSGPLP